MLEASDMPRVISKSKIVKFSDIKVCEKSSMVGLNMNNNAE